MTLIVIGIMRRIDLAARRVKPVCLIRDTHLRQARSLPGRPMA
jgi:hypothetical protein